MRCPDCGSTDIQTIGHETICRMCSLVIEDSPVQHTSKDIVFASHPSIAEAGTYQYDGKIVRSQWFYSTQQKNLQVAQTQINLAISRLKLPERIGKEAILLFTRVVRSGLNKGRDNLSFMYASVYAASLIHGTPKTPLEVTRYSSINVVRLLRAFRMLARGLKLKLPTIKPIDLLREQSHD
jgi:transcription initiation factor TFIIIB Brf1 subunit/transcription initiation factor TFIIB